MFKSFALFAVIACSSAQILRFNPLTLGSTHSADLQTIQLHTSPRIATVGRPLAFRAHAPAVAVAAPAIAPVAFAAPQPHLAIAAAPLSRAAHLARPHIAFSQPAIDLRDEAPEPYTYGFTSVDEFGTQMSRQEQADGSGTVTGSYTLSDPDGRQRVVEYIADAAGFRATVRTNEPGTANANPADVQIQSSAPNRR